MPTAHRVFIGSHDVGSLQIHGIYLGGSLSFNNVAMILSASGTTAKTLSISLGLYSLTGSTLSLANSASQSTNPTANQLSWVSLVTSTTQNITPGNWYFGFLISTSNNSLVSFMGRAIGIATFGSQGGAFVRGRLSVSTSALPSSIATSDLVKEGAVAGATPNRHPYILITA